VGGDTFGMDGDAFLRIPDDVSSVVDLLDTKGISWGEYQEDEPYPGYQGFNYSKTSAADYVRKHNPLILYDSVTKNDTRLNLIKGFDDFKNDVSKKTLPQWSFLTPNMLNDGHDTNVTFASAWERGFLAGFLNDTYFTNNTLILLTFDEIETYPLPNKVYAILLGGVIPKSLQGTIDNTFYTHYSALSTVSVNWGLPSLGRWDCSANVFQVVANKTNYTNYEVDTTHLFLNSSYPGPLSEKKYIPDWPIPDVSAKCASGMGVLNSVKTTYTGKKPTFNYSGSPFPYDDQSGVNVGVSFKPQSSTTSAAPSATSSKGAALPTADVPGSLLAVLGGVVAFLV
jgi:acid phosphatase